MGDPTSSLVHLNVNFRILSFPLGCWNSRTCKTSLKRRKSLPGPLLGSKADDLKLLLYKTIILELLLVALSPSLKMKLMESSFSLVFDSS